MYSVWNFKCCVTRWVGKRHRAPRGIRKHVVCIHQAHFPSSPCSVVSWARLSCRGSESLPVRLDARHSCFVFTALWCGCFVVKLPFYFDQTPSWLWLVWTNYLSSPRPGYRPISTTVQIIPVLHHITDTHQVHEYLDSSISILKWRMTTTLKRKLLEKQRVQNCFASYEKYIGHFFYNINATVSFGNR